MKIVQPTFEIMDHNNLMRNIELGGRVCYKSEDAMGEGSDERLINKLKGFKHECYDADTEVLTSYGWKNWADVNSDDKFATRTASGEIEYHRSIHLYSAHHKGKMYRVDSNCVDLLVTENHRMLVCKTSTLSGRKKQNFEFITASELDESAHCYIKTGSWNTNVYLNVSLDSLRLLGFAIGDGWIAGNRLAFKIRKARKVEYLTKIASSLGLDLRVLFNDAFSVLIPKDATSLFADIRTDLEDKKLPNQILLSTNKEQLEAILDGLMNSDGHKGRTSSCYDTVSKTLADQIQQLCLHIGIAGTVRLREQHEDAFGSRPVYRVTILTRALKPEVNKLEGKFGQTSWVDYDGMVYCAEVPNNTLYVRRNGSAVWCGNSVFEHGVITVKFLTDRGVTHELVRHRVASFSQESTRYCNYGKGKFGSEITVVEPFFFESGSDKHTRWKVSCMGAERDYLYLLGIGASAQEARSVLPNSLKTEIQVTCNVREWCHILRLRTAREAHPQIRQIMVPLGLELAKRWPVLFGEFADCVHSHPATEVVG